LWQFVDEAGDPTIFHDSGKVIADTPGCSRFFMLGKLEVDDPPALGNGLGLQDFRGQGGCEQVCE